MSLFNPAALRLTVKVTVLVAVAVLCEAEPVAAQGPSAQERPELFSFALDGRVREVKSECAGDTCTSYVLLRTPTEDDEDDEDDAVGAVGGSSPEGLRNVELWSLVVPATAQSSAEASIRRLRSSVPADAGRLALCATNSSRSLVMLQALGSVYFVDPASEDQPLAPGTRVGSAKWSAPAAPWTTDCSELMLVGPGAVRQVTLAGRGPRRSVLSVTELPIHFSIRRNGSGLTLESPPVRRIDQGSGLVAVGPKIYDHLRIESLVFEPTADSAHWLQDLGTDADGNDAEDGTAQRAWSRLPAAEEILQSRYLSLEGQLVLVVVTKEADKIGLLERKKLRLFRLTADRTRAGRLPFFEALTSSRLWQRLDIQFIDVTGDGVNDLVLVQPEGLSGEPTLVDVFAATAPLQFSSKKSRTVLETGAAWWSLENDWNGDGQADVAVLDGQVLQFHNAQWQAASAGKASDGKRKKRQAYWASEPSYRMELVDRASSRLDLGLLTGAESGGSSPTDGSEESLSEMVSSIFQKVWVDDGMMVIPTVFEGSSQPSDEEAELIEISVVEEEDQDRKDDDDEAKPAAENRGLIFVVRAPNVGTAPDR